MNAHFLSLIVTHIPAVYVLIGDCRFSSVAVVYIKALLIYTLGYIPETPINIQPVVVVRGLKRQQAAALTNFCWMLSSHCIFISFFPPSVCAE